MYIHILHVYIYGNTKPTNSQINKYSNIYVYIYIYIIEYR